MGDTNKGIADLTDEEIAGMSDEELQAAVDADAAAAEADAGEEGEEGGEQDDADDANAAGKDDGDDDGAVNGEDDGADDAGDEGDGNLTREQLERLAGDPESDDGKDDMVPRARLNEVLQTADDLRMILRTVIGNKQAEAPAPEPKEEPKRPEYDFKAAQREYHKLLTEGEEEKALDKLDEIEDARAALHTFDVSAARREAADEAYGRSAADQNKRELDAVAGEMVKRYPFLDNQNEKANEAAILAVNAKAKQLVAKGKSPAEALHEAATKIGGQFAKVLEIPGKTDKSGKSGKGKTAVEPGKDPRSTEALRRNLGVRQPPAAKAGVGTREQVRTLDISKMTDEQIDKLSPDELAEMLGNDRLG